MDKKKTNSKYAYGLDILRIICTVAVLAYHINPDWLPGGYLAVCTFLVMHGYLFIVSNDGRKKFSVFGYWAKRIYRLYLPVLAVVGLTMLALQYFPDIIWLNEKPESLSVVMGINNWWQINAGQSYFTRLTNSPFTHMWYIAMLLQVEVILPIWYKAYDFLKKRANFWLLWVSFVLLTVIATLVIPVYKRMEIPEMRLYYGTDARCFSILMGMSLGMLMTYSKKPNVVLLKKKVVSELVSLVILAGLIWLFVAVGTASPLYEYGFVIASLVSVLLISVIGNSAYPVFRTLRNPITGPVSSISYEVYLTHYPVMFLGLTYLDLSAGKDIVIYLGIVLALSTILHFAFSISIKKNEKIRPVTYLKFAALIPVLIATGMGGYQLYLAEDYTEEMKELERQLAEAAEVQNQLQEDFLKKRQEEMELLSDPAAMAADVGAANLPVTCIGDSVMLGAVSRLNETFPNGDVDAQQNRSHYPVLDIVTSRNGNNTLGNPVVIGIGTNATMPLSFGERIVRACGDRRIYWLTTTNNWQFANRETILKLGEEFENVTVLDWETYSSGQSDWFYHDGIHLTPDGRRAYANFILEGIARDLATRKYEELSKNQVLGVGDGFLLRSVEQLQGSLTDSIIYAEEDLDFSSVISNLSSLKENGIMPSRAFVTIGNDQSIAEEDIRKLLDALSDSRVILIKMPLLSNNKTNKTIDKIIGEYDNVKVLSWEDQYKENRDYFTPDRVHLSEQGSKVFAEYIQQQLEELRNEETADSAD